MYICLGKTCNFDIKYLKKKDRRQQGQGGLMVMTPDFHPGDLGSIPLEGDKSFFHFYTYFQSSAQ